MQKMISITTAGEFAEALENWIIDNKCNPKTPEEWSRCIEDLIAAGKLQAVAIVEDEDVSKIKKELKDNFNVGEL